MSPAMQCLLSWFSTNGGFLHQNVEVASGSVDGYHLLVKNGCSVSSRDCILSCPRELTFSIFNLREKIYPWLDQLKLKWHDALEVPTRFFLMEQYLIKEGSFWWPYIQTIPQPNNEKGLQTPLYYEQDDLAWIHGTNLDGGRNHRTLIWREQYEGSMLVLKQERSTHELSGNRISQVQHYTWYES